MERKQEMTQNAFNNNITKDGLTGYKITKTM